jgi:hypothetical protein
MLLHARVLAAGAQQPSADAPSRSGKIGLSRQARDPHLHDARVQAAPVKSQMRSGSTWKLHIAGWVAGEIRGTV